MDYREFEETFGDMADACGLAAVAALSPTARAALGKGGDAPNDGLAGDIAHFILERIKAALAVGA